nr:tetratricopeptide-like helical [Tanacetum cinerariifolium]
LWSKDVCGDPEQRHKTFLQSFIDRAFLLQRGNVATVEQEVAATVESMEKAARYTLNKYVKAALNSATVVLPYLVPSDAEIFHRLQIVLRYFSNLSTRTDGGVRDFGLDIHLCDKITFGDSRCDLTYRVLVHLQQLEEYIKKEKVKAVHLKHAGKQAEALDALRRAKMLEKKLNT